MKDTDRGLVDTFSNLVYSYTKNQKRKAIFDHGITQAFTVTFFSSSSPYMCMGYYFHLTSAF